MRVGVLFSGGKDSTMALDWAIEHHEPLVLVTIRSENPDSYMFHTELIDLVPKQAKSIGLPLIEKKTKGNKEYELRSLRAAIKEAKAEFDLGGIVVGALASQYQKIRVQRICNQMNLACFTPYWHFKPEEYMKLLISKGYKVIISKVSSGGLSNEWVGFELDEPTIEHLKALSEKYGFHLAGEGGEYETFVYDGPIFKKPVKVTLSSQ